MHTPTKITAICIAALFMFVAPRPTASIAPQPTVAADTTVSGQRTLPFQVTTTSSTVPLPLDARCPMWWSMAKQIGFTDALLPTLDRVIYRESRCDPSQHNASDPNGGSHGLTQVNGFWCKPSRYYPSGYLQTVGVLNDCADLYTPEVALRATMALIIYSRSVDLCTWAQWAWLTPCED